MRSTEIKSLIEKDPNAEFAVSKSLLENAESYIKIRGLSEINPGKWVSREVLSSNKKWIIKERLLKSTEIISTRIADKIIYNNKKKREEKDLQKKQKSKRLKEVILAFRSLGIESDYGYDDNCLQIEGDFLENLEKLLGLNTNKVFVLLERNEVIADFLEENGKVEAADKLRVK